MHLTPEITFVPVPDARKSGEIIVGPNDTAPTVGADGQEQVASPAGNAFTPEIASRKQGLTLVHCQAGLNRSAFITAYAFIKSGLAPQEAISLLREKRSPAVLCNGTFERWLLERKTP